ncbi:DNA-binding LacI/PurR family transcriptional regulator [Kutzneria kofuensis]|uniref:DNA-binding LacI/PurR family transcriptional regulator n=1 Tax=Kutzneria kofuensis TaxID=103725 RepID=A0A7W9NML2_9PSEU|nr:DNA-binding LacI/PurR family transcriptional regulator [Kutzneria kofuensis]
MTIIDVARAAGVAPSTVSYVLSGKRSISPQTRRAVEQSIRKLGYHPHAGARSLATSRTNVLALVAPLREDLTVMDFVAAVATAARNHDQDLLLLTKDEGPAALRRVISSAIADALIVMEVEAADPRVPTLLALDRPVVLIGAPDQPVDLSSVDLDFAAAGGRCVEHLADLGHRSIAMVGPAPSVYQRGISSAGRFLSGLTDAAQAHGVVAKARPCAHNYDAVRACLDALLATEPTGLVVNNEAVLPTVLAELHRRGLRVPDDISVVAVCSDSAATSGAVPLTTVPIPTVELGELAVEMIIRQLGRDAQPETRLLAPRLTPRASTALRS